MSATDTRPLSITSVSTLASTSDGNVYTVNGTLTATLRADPSTAATGMVTLNATF